MDKKLLATLITAAIINNNPELVMLKGAIESTILEVLNTELVEPAAKGLLSILKGLFS